MPHAAVDALVGVFVFVVVVVVVVVAAAAAAAAVDEVSTRLPCSIRELPHFGRCLRGGKCQ